MVYRSRHARWGAAWMALLCVTGPLHAQLRIVNYNIASLNGNQTSLQNVLNDLMIDDKPGFAVFPTAICFQEVQSVDANALQVLLDNATAPYSFSYTRATFTVINNENTSGGAQCMFYRNSVLTEFVPGHVDIFTQAGRYCDRWAMTLNGYGSPLVQFYIYSAHLKAGNTSQDQIDRNLGAAAIKNNANALGPGQHIIYTGDFNLYVNTEPAYLTFLQATNAQAFDPLGTGSWAGSSNALKHTQAPCNSPCTLVGGGMNDRFDFQLSTAAFQDGEGLAIMSLPWKYRSFGNDGLHYNVAINAGNNQYYSGDLPRSNALAAALYDGSDHVPLIVDYQIPAVCSANLPASFGRVIQGAAYNVQLSISNTASVVIADGADELDYNAVGSGGLSGSANGMVMALAPAATHNYAVNTSTVGPVSGSVDVTSTSQGAQGVPTTLNTGGTIVRPSNASFDGGSDVNATTVSDNFSPNSGVHNLTVDVYNLGFDASQALLDIDSTSALSPPFAYVSGLTNGVGATPATLTFSFDTTGASPGLHSANVTLNVSDEDIPGAANAQLDLTLEVTIATPVLGDVDCDGDVDLDDVTAFAAVLVGTDTNPCHMSSSDFDSNSKLDGQDIPLFVAAFLVS